MKIQHVLGFAVVGVLAMPTSAAAQLTPTAAIKRAVENNPSFKEAGLVVRASEIRLRGQDALRPFILSADGGYNFSEQAQAGVTNTGVSKTTYASLSADLAKQLVWGTQIGLGLDFNSSESQIPFTVPDLMINEIREIGPNYGGSLELSVVQPILKGFGSDLNDLPRAAARQELTVSELQREVAAHDLASQVLTAYWSWVRAERELAALEKGLERTKTIADMTIAQIEAGQLAELERDIVDQRIAQAEQGVLLSRAAAQDAWQSLEKSMGVPIGGKVESVPERLVSPPDTLPAVSSLIKAAVESNPDLRLLNQDIAANKLQLRQSANDVRPQLDAIGRISQTSLDESVGGSLEQLATLDFTSYFIGLQFVMPLDNGLAESSHEANLIAVERAELRKVQALREIEQSVRQARRLLSTQRERLLLSNREVMLAEKNLGALEEKYKAGLASYFEVLEQQSALEDAELTNAQASVDLLQAEITVQRLTGTLLEAYDVEIERGAKAQ